MMHLVYVSVASRPMSGQGLTDLLIQSRAANERVAVTGMLLYSRGMFLQVLEGAETEVREIYAKIVRDERHHDVRKVIDEPIRARDFPDWSMGFERLPDAEVDGLEGYADVFGTDRPEDGLFRDLDVLRRFLALFAPAKDSRQR